MALTKEIISTLDVEQAIARAITFTMNNANMQRQENVSREIASPYQDPPKSGDMSWEKPMLQKCLVVRKLKKRKKVLKLEHLYQEGRDQHLQVFEGGTKVGNRGLQVLIRGAKIGEQGLRVINIIIQDQREDLYCIVFLHLFPHLTLPLKITPIQRNYHLSKQ